MDKEKRSRLWHDFILGIHNRSLMKIDDNDWESRNDAGQQMYGYKYNIIYDEYIEVIDHNMIYE